MINSKTTTIIFFILLFLLNIFSLVFYRVDPVLYVLLFGIYFIVMIAFSFFVCSGFYVKTYCRAETAEKKIALTFDDGPDPEVTGKILDLLKERGKATFFCIGRKIAGHETILRRINEEGHLLGNHTFTHSDWFDLFPSRKMIKELEKTEHSIAAVIGRQPLLFRPPYGVINPMVRRALSHFNYQVIGFSNRAWDTSSANPDKIASRLIKNLKPGDIVLLHDSVPSCPTVLEKFLVYLDNNGYSIVQLDELLNIKAYV